MDDFSAKEEMAPKVRVNLRIGEKIEDKEQQRNEECLLECQLHTATEISGTLGYALFCKRAYSFPAGIG